MRFRTSNGDYAISVEQVAEVRRAIDLTPLPAPRPGVAGVVRRGDDVLTVLSVLGEGGAHVIVVDAEGLTFGLLVDEVTGVHRVDDSAVGPAPHGQVAGVVAGAIVEDDGVLLLLDAVALRERLKP